MNRTPASPQAGAISALLLCLLTPWAARAQTSYPMLMSLEPTAARIGATTEHTLHSRYTMWGASSVIVEGEGVRGEIVHPELKPGQQPPNLQALQLRFHVDAQATPGVRDFRLITPRGASTLGQLVLTPDPVVVEDSKAAEPQTVALPATICGAISAAEDVDEFRFVAAAGEKLSFHVRSMRLQDRIHDLQQHVDPILTLRNAAGVTIAAADNEFYGDPFLAYTFAEEGEYVLEIRDVRYQGNKYWQYCIEANDRPFIAQTYPSAVQRGESAALELIGAHLGEQPACLFTAPADAPPGAQVVRLQAGEREAFAPLLIVERPVLLEDDSPHAAADSAQPLDASAEAPSAGLTVCGRIALPAEVDCYAFPARKGVRYQFEIKARRFGSELDSHLRILDAQGKQLALNDDLRFGKRTYSDSQIIGWTAPADGLHIVEVRDLHLRGGPGFVYLLEIEESQPGFDLFLDSDKTQLTPGCGGVIFVRAERYNGFDAPIALQIDGLPPGVQATCGVIPAGKKNDGCILLTAAPDAGPSAANVAIRGSAVQPVDSQATNTLTRSAHAYQETYQPGGGRGHYPATMHTVAVHPPQDILAVELDRSEVRLKPGEKQAVKVTIRRAPGFDKNVTLDVLMKHLNSVYGDTLPEGVSVAGGASKTLLTAGASEGVLTLQAAADAPPCSAQVVPVMANVSLNFVMKATYAAAPLMVSVEAP